MDEVSKARTEPLYKLINALVRRVPYIAFV